MSASPINVAKNAQGYINASARPRCGNCAHVKTASGPVPSPQLHCHLGRFMVTQYACCSHWQLNDEVVR